MPVHNIQPIFDKHSKVIILGSFPSPISRETGFYYGNPRNRMWKVLANVFQETEPKKITNKIAFLLKHKIAMWDILQSCEIVGAQDSTIQKETPNDLSIVFESATIWAVFTAGQKAAQLYTKHNQYNIPHVVLPSTSPANAAYSINKLTKVYKENILKFL